MSNQTQMTEAEAAELDRKAREAYEAIGSSPANTTSSFPVEPKAAPLDGLAVVFAEDGPTDYSDIERTYVEEFDAEGWAAIAPVDEFDVAGTAPLELYESTTDPANVANIVEADGPTPHPAKFSPSILEAIEDALQEYAGTGQRILDPFAGVGGIHVLRDPDRGGHETWGVELEPEWAQQSPFTVTGDSRNLSGLKELGPWDAIVTSPAYGNRMADSYNGRDGSRRHTYRISLGRPLTEGNTGALHWRNDEYRILHSEVWAECAGLVRPGGLVIINVSNFIAQGAEQHVVEWHLQSWLHLGFKLIEARRVTTPRMKHGANHDARVAGEMLLVLEAPK